MKLKLKSLVTISALAATAIAPFLLSVGSASAQPNGTDASYIGAGVAAGITNGGSVTGGDAATIGGNIQGRVAVPKLPVSARGAVLFSDETSAIIPQVTYDIGVAKNTNVYVGGGYSFVESKGKPTPLGNQSAPVVTIGAESQITDNLVVYGDAKAGINAYQNSSGSAVSFQAGAGFKF
ncbi:MAG: hypothetical protein U7123_19235 [Potamolinea sp.]